MLATVERMCHSPDVPPSLPAHGPLAPVERESDVLPCVFEVVLATVASAAASAVPAAVPAVAAAAATAAAAAASTVTIDARLLLLPPPLL